MINSTGYNFNFLLYTFTGLVNVLQQTCINANQKNKSES